MMVHYIRISGFTADACLRAIDKCGKMTGLSHISKLVPDTWIKSGQLNGKFLMYRADVKRTTLALRLYKAYISKYEYIIIDSAIQELEEKWEKGRSGHTHDKER